MAFLGSLFNLGSIPVRARSRARAATLLTWTSGIGAVLVTIFVAVRSVFRLSGPKKERNPQKFKANPLVCLDLP